MSGLVKAVFGGIGSLLGIGGKKQIKALPQVSRDAADATLASQDELARRRGSAADMMNGTTGYEAGASTTGRLVVGS
jgi:hypothetical protein